MAKHRKKSKLHKRKVSRKQRAALAKGRAKRLKNLRSKRKSKSSRRKRRKNPATRAQVRAAMAASKQASGGTSIWTKPKRRRRKKKAAAAGAVTKKHRKSAKRRKASKITRKRVKRIKTLNRKIKKARHYMKVGRKSKRGKRKASVKRKIHRTRISAMQLQKKALRKRGMSKANRGKMAAYGLWKVNPSLSGVGKQLVSILPEIGVGMVAVAATAWVAQKVAAKVAEMVPSVPESIKPYVPAVSVGVVGVAAYALMQMSGNSKLVRFSMPVLMASACAMMVKASQAMVMKDGATLSAKVGLGEYVLGEYVSVNGYLPQGEYVQSMDGMGSIFNESTLGGPPLLSDGRDPVHGTGGEASVYDFENPGADAGVLQGGIFDD